MNQDIEMIERKRILDSFLKVDLCVLRHSAFDGGWVGPMAREVVIRPACVAVMPYDPVADKILLIEQFRLPAHLANMPAWQREVIAGMNDKNESMEDLARREALEEANCQLGELIEMYHYMVSPGMTNETLTLFLGRFDSASWQGGIHGLDHEHEDIRTTLHDVGEIPDILAHRHTGNGILILALQWFLLNRDKVRQQWR
ncbi:MAG: NUDIX domain-containing protein [Dongiaceae bacterium]